MSCDLAYDKFELLILKCNFEKKELGDAGKAHICQIDDKLNKHEIKEPCEQTFTQSARVLNVCLKINSCLVLYERIDKTWKCVNTVF